MKVRVCQMDYNGWRADVRFGRLDVSAYGRTRRNATWNAVRDAFYMARQYGLAGTGWKP